jgi:hypothetical protein
MTAITLLWLLLLTISNCLLRNKAKTKTLRKTQGFLYLCAGDLLR